MLGIFGGTQSGHPLADLKEAKRIAAAFPAGEAFASLEEIAHWFESVRNETDFKPEHRAQLVQLFDEAGQAHARKLSREYLAAARQGKRDEQRLWKAIHAFWSEAALGYITCIDAYATGAKGGDALKGSLALLGARGLRALAQQLKWLQCRYGPVDERLWTMMSRTYALLESKKLARAKVVPYPGLGPESTPELEFLRAVMFSACSPDSLLPPELEIAERVITQLSPGFLFVSQHQPETPYWIDLAQAAGPARLARTPQPGPTVRFFGAGRAFGEIDAMVQHIRNTRDVPATLTLGGTCSPDTAIGVLEHLEQCWSPKLPERRHARHRVKSRLTIAWGFDGIQEVLAPGKSTSLSFDGSNFESWIVENVSVGGFGALVPQVRGDWLRIGCLIAMQPEGGDNWLDRRDPPSVAPVGHPGRGRDPDARALGRPGPAPRPDGQHDHARHRDRDHPRCASARRRGAGAAPARCTRPRTELHVRLQRPAHDAAAAWGRRATTRLRAAALPAHGARRGLSRTRGESTRGRCPLFL